MSVDFHEREDDKKKKKQATSRQGPDQSSSKTHTHKRLGVPHKNSTAKQISPKSSAAWLLWMSEWPSQKRISSPAVTARSGPSSNSVGESTLALTSEYEYGVVAVTSVVLLTAYILLFAASVTNSVYVLGG